MRQSDNHKLYHRGTIVWFLYILEGRRSSVLKYETTAAHLITQSLNIHMATAARAVEASAEVMPCLIFSTNKTNRMIDFFLKLLCNCFKAVAITPTSQLIIAAENWGQPVEATGSLAGVRALASTELCTLQEPFENGCKLSKNSISSTTSVC